MFKKICVGLFLAIGLVFVQTHDASASILGKLVGSLVGGGIGNADAEMNGICDTFAQNLQDYSDQNHCWTCEIFVLLFDSANVVSGQINNTLAKPVLNLVIVGGLVWLSFVTLVFFGNIGDAPNPMEYLTKVGSIMLRVGIAGCFLAGGSSVAFNYIVNPVLSSGVQLASSTLSMTGAGISMAGNSGSSGDAVSSMEAWTHGSRGRIESQFGGSSSSFKAKGSGSGPMGDGVRNSLKQMIYRMSSGMARAQAVSQGLRCGAFFWKKVSFGALIPIPDFLVPNPLMWAVGAWLGCIFWIISIMFCMAMLDVIFRIGLLVGILPVFIAAWVFPITGAFAKTAWEMFLNSVLVFFITAIVAALVVILSERAWESGPSGSFSSFMSQMQANSYVEAWDSLFAGGASDGLTTLFIVSAVALWAWAISPKADGVAEKILGASFSSSVAIKALHAMIDFFMNLVMMVFTIVTAGAAACMYLLKIFSFFKKSMDTLKKIQETMDKIERFQAKVRKIRALALKAKKAADMAKKAIPKA